MQRRQRVPVQVQQFVGGINTEANPLSFPPTASIDEVNMEVNRDGSRQRRNGFDVEPNYEIQDTGVVRQPTLEAATSQFRWTDTISLVEKELLIIQTGNRIAIHDLNEQPVSQTPIFVKVFDASTYGTTFTYAQVDGLVVMTTGESVVYTIDYNYGDVTVVEDSLLIRDLFGVEAYGESKGVVEELTNPTNIQIRPVTLESAHLYNLRNQTFALPRVANTSDNILADTIDEFRKGAVARGGGTDVYPSNADNAVRFIYPNTSIASDREVDRFYGESMYQSPPSTTKSPVGYFIIDALSRGASRITEERKLRDKYPSLISAVTTLPEDRTPGGVNVVTQYSGRLWYAGFSSQVVGAHKKSPRLGSYILFSQVVQDPSDINLCYQSADPTSVDDPNIADTDGGFIKIDGAYGIKNLISIDASLFVVAENGVWRIVGVDESTFTASSYSVSKISESGCLSSQSVVVTDKSFTYWSEYGIYGVAQSEVGDWTVTNLTQTTIQTLYDEIPLEAKGRTVGYYDESNSRIRWVWLAEEGLAGELIFNLEQAGFTRNEVKLPSSVERLGGMVIGALAEGTETGTVTLINGEPVYSGGSTVETLLTQIRRGVTNAYYLILINDGPTIKYTFGRYNRADTTYDWSRYGSSLDSPAFIMAGSLTGGDGRLRKNVPYLTVYFNQVEDGVPDSECILTAQWDWTKSYLTGKWSSPRQIYRVQRTSNDGGLLVTKNKIRGFGNSVAFSFESVEGKGMHIYGWEFNIEATGTE